jgi:hypothetical protein
LRVLTEIPSNKRGPESVFDFAGGESRISPRLVIMLPTFAYPLRRLGAFFAASVFGGLAHGAALEPAQVEFFENRIRPLLVDHCYECHSAKSEKVKGGLQLDTKAALLKGGASGVALVPGKPTESLLVQVVRGTAKDVDRMPPEKKGHPLKPEQIAALEEWVQMGAPDPREDEDAKLKAQSANAKQHWAFQRPVAPKIPEVQSSKFKVQGPIDAFVATKLAEKGLTQTPAADKHTLLRRVTFDLTGLPPTPAEMRDFLADDSPLAFEKVVDRLLASPRYGERWGRHWLDVARYADSKGYVFEEERRYAYAYTYRDWVVKALNDDLPYDEFLIQQIAGDQVATPDNPWPMAAQGFLTLGRRFLNNQNDIIDDRLDVVFRGTMGLTVACARCHDHKFDPIPTADYYSLYGVFASSREPDEKPLLGANPNPVQAAEFERERAKRRRELQEFQDAKVVEVARQLRGQVGDYLLGWHDTQGLDDEARTKLLRSRSLPPHIANKWRPRFEAWKKQPDPVMGPFLEFSALATNDFAAQASALAKTVAGGSLKDARLNVRVAAMFATNSPASVAEVAGLYGSLFKAVDAEWQALLEAAKKESKPLPTRLPDDEAEVLRNFLYADGSPTVVNWDEAYQAAPTPDQQKFRALRRKVDELDATHPGAPLRAMALVDKDAPSEPVIFKRGNPGNHGPKVPRQMLEIVAGLERKPFEKGSGRLELAQAIASRDNPLTARVMVNRVWLRYFGAPLVRTPSDFGVRSDPPSHPELLDHLAVWFMDHGWSLKQLHRYLVLSSTYQQASDPGADGATQRAFAANDKVDPTNVLLWRMNRKRHDFETMRDSLLAVSGQLEGSLGGQPVEIYEGKDAPRRTLYGYIDRQNLPGVLRVFDFASPDATSPMRFQTTVPQQALFMLNSGFMVARAREFLRRPEVAAAPDVAGKISRLHELAYQREPTSDESRLGLGFVSQAVTVPPDPEPPSAWSYGTGQFDPATERVQKWRGLPHFTGKAWQWEEKLPSGAGQWTFLNAAGGHPGNGVANAAIRRWTSPIAGVVRIEGTLEHSSDQGDGVRGRIVSSRSGEAGTWVSKNGKQATEVKELPVERGDTIDFVVEAQESENSDSFTWAPIVTVIRDGAGMSAAANRRWNAQRDFSGTREFPVALTPWEQYAQVLLSANEFVFVD